VPASAALRVWRVSSLAPSAICGADDGELLEDAGELDPEHDGGGKVMLKTLWLTDNFMVRGNQKRVVSPAKMLRSSAARVRPMLAPRSNCRCLVAVYVRPQLKEAMSVWCARVVASST